MRYTQIQSLVVDTHSRDPYDYNLCKNSQINIFALQVVHIESLVGHNHLYTGMKTLQCVL